MRHLPDRNKKILIKKLRYYKSLHFPGKGSGLRLADEVGVPPQTLSNWLSGRRLPTAMQLYRLSKVFNVSPLELCGISKKSADQNNNPHIDVLFSALVRCKNLFVVDENIGIRRKILKELKDIIHKELQSG